MSWLRIDDTFVEHPKVIDLSDRAFRLHVAGMSFCARNLTDGVLVKRSVNVVCALTSATRKHVSELVEAGLWIAEGDGFSIKDFLIYNPRAEKVKAERDAARDRMRRVRSRERSGERSATPDPDPSLEQAGSSGVSEDFQPPEQIRAVAALVEKSLKSGVPGAVPEPPHPAATGVDVLLALLPAHEIAANTRGVLERKFAQLPPHFVGLAREELLAAGDDVRSRIRYLNGIADRMLRERADRATPAADRDSWVRANFDHPDVHQVIDHEWRDLDDVDRQQLHDLADRLAGESTSTREAA